MREEKNWEQGKGPEEMDELNYLSKELKKLQKEISQCPECKKLEERLANLEKASAKEKAEEIERIKEELERLKNSGKRSEKENPNPSQPEWVEKKLKEVANKWRRQAAWAVEELVPKAVPKFLR